MWAHVLVQQNVIAEELVVVVVRLQLLPPAHRNLRPEQRRVPWKKTEYFPLQKGKQYCNTKGFKNNVECILRPLGLNVVGASAIRLSRLCRKVRETRHSRMSTRHPAISGILWPGSLMPRLEIETELHSPHVKVFLYMAVIHNYLFLLFYENI